MDNLLAQGTGKPSVWVTVERFAGGFGVTSPTGTRVGIPHKVADDTPIRWPVRMIQCGHYGEVIRFQITLEAMRRLLDYVDAKMDFSPYKPPKPKKAVIVDRHKFKPVGKNAARIKRNFNVLKQVRQFKELRVISPYQVRVNDHFDVWLKSGKFHNKDTGKRGTISLHKPKEIWAGYCRHTPSAKINVSKDT